ncbi:MAG: hypothetical protein Q9195_004242 [Heterodermia aff. obscurata]
MVVRTIFVTRHGFRGTWDLDLDSGIYTSKFLSPTKIPVDPPLVAYGVQQSHQLADALISTVPRISRIYSSPYYRCLETIRPAAEKLELRINADNGIGEWFGQAPFPHPGPATASLLNTLFPSLETNYTPSCYPPATGEPLPQLYARIAFALSYIIADADSASGDPEVALVICTHAAPLIIIGRVLTGNLPSNVGEQDFRAFTAGLSRFERRQIPTRYIKKSGFHVQDEPPNIDWEAGNGLSGGWDCVVNCDCTHLKGGEERGW